MAEAFPGSSSAQISTMDNENEVPNALAVPDSGDEGNSSSSSSTTESYNATAALSFRTSGPSSPGPVILDYSFSGLETNDFGEALENQPSRVFKSVETILAANNSLIHIPDFISRYTNLRQLDLSNNQLTDIPDVISLCKNLTTFIARNNLLDEHSFPKNIKNLTKLKELNLSGNLLTRIPYEVLEVSSLQSLHLGANHIEFVTKDIKLMKKLEVLYLGGNQISELPFEIGELVNLKVFVLCENRLECLPKSVSTLKHLKSLLLHRNQLTALPVELIKLRNLMEVNKISCFILKIHKLEFDASC
jgi:Leucine-rich repeat (LRR) protein